jgi:hypothetical protein
MTPQQLVALGARFYAIWLLVLAIRLIFSGIAIGAQMSQPLPMALAGALLPAVLAVFFWYCPLYIGNKLVPHTGHTNVIDLPARELAAVASAALGLWTIVEAIPVVFAVIRETQSPGYYVDLSGKLLMLTAAAQFGIGVFLLCRPWFIADKVFQGPARDMNVAKSPNPLP